MPRDDSVIWSEEGRDALRRDLGDAYEGRTCVVTGADGFMGSHLTEALVHLESVTGGSTGPARSFGPRSTSQAARPPLVVYWACGPGPCPPMVVGVGTDLPYRDDRPGGVDGHLAT